MSISTDPGHPHRCTQSTGQWGWPSDSTLKTRQSSTGVWDAHTTEQDVAVKDERGGQVLTKLSETPQYVTIKPRPELRKLMLTCE